MGKKKNSPPLYPITILCLLFVALCAGLLLKTGQKPQNFIPPGITKPTPTTAPSSEITAVLVDVAVAYPSAPWTQPSITTQQTAYGNLSGGFISAPGIVSKTAYLEPFMSVFELNKIGFTQDNNLAANGPGSGSWGYKRRIDNKSQILVFSYTTHPTTNKPNEPLQFNCPCSMDISVFVSNPW